jgi:hypothetical protein
MDFRGAVACRDRWRSPTSPTAPPRDKARQWDQPSDKDLVRLFDEGKAVQADDFHVDEPEVPLPRRKDLPAVRLRRKVDVVALLRADRDQR